VIIKFDVALIMRYFYNIRLGPTRATICLGDSLALLCDLRTLSNIVFEL